MKSQSLLSLSAWFLAALAMPLTAVAQDTSSRQPTLPTRYTVVDLGTLSGGNFSQPITINASGVIAGSSTLSNNDQHAVLWSSRGHIKDLGTLGGSNSLANGLNNAGLAVGQAETSASDPNGEDFCGFGSHLICQPFLWQNNVLNPLATLGGNNGVANRINRWGTAVGYAENTIVDSNCPAPQKFQFLPVEWKEGRPTRLRIPKGDTEGVAFTINNSGQIVGTSGTCTTLNPIWLFYLQPAHALLWDHGKKVDLGSLGGSYGNMAVFINNGGQVVGLSDLAGDTTSHGFLWTKATGMKDLGTYPGDIGSAAISINDLGVIVGLSIIDTKGDSRAVVWNNGVLTDLNTLVQANPPLYLITACAINNAGEISGLGFTSSGEIHTYRAVPIQNGSSVERQP
jgi:probable HAF family extracellular repeat protein